MFQGSRLSVFQTLTVSHIQSECSENGAPVGMVEALTKTFHQSLKFGASRTDALAMFQVKS